MMSPNKSKKGAVTIRDSSPEAGPSCSKRPRSKMSSDDEEESAPRKAAPSKHGSNFIRSPGFTAHNKPAELFRKDLISAMKLADSEPLQEGSYFLISDPWRQEWEKGVQVPVNNTQIMQAEVKEIREKSKTGDFKMPHKLLHERVDSTYKKGHHELTGMQQLAEQLVRYDLDDLDVCWLDEVNFSRREMGLEQINEWNMERIMEALENQCHEKMTAVMKTEEGMGIEYDEDVVCDVCRSPESEDTNEMVFCDGCDVCIHQACYGIQSIPDGSWLCRTCALGIKPGCMLCPKMGGAMKSTRSGTKWAHVSCALWIPEVSIGVPEKMEPITKISNIPPSRWALICCLCKERVGACIQCSVKTCKTAFHVTCGFNNNLEMKTILDESDEHDGVKLKAYCPKHTKKRERGHSESDTDSPRKESPPTPKKELTQQEKANLRAKKCLTPRTSLGVPNLDCPSSPVDPTALKSLEEEFYSVVDVTEICKALQLEEEVVDIVRVYWQLKRKCNWDKPLLTPKTEEADILEKQQEDSLVARMKMFVHLRQDLERVRNLCYMIGKREKMKRQFFRSREYVFTSMVRVLLDKTINLSDADVDDIVHNYHFDSIYDDYGRSVQNLPPEPSQDEDEGAEREEKDVAKDGGESAVDDGREVTTAEEVEEEEMEEEPSQPLPPGERWSGEFVRSGFFHRRRHKKWMKGALIGKAKRKKHQVATSSTGTSASAAVIKQDRAEDESVFFADADESEDEKEKAAPVVKENLGDKAEGRSNGSQPPIPKLVVKSRRGFHLHRHRKRHRGRKPWHVKKSHHYDMAPKLDLSTDEDEDMKVLPILECSKAADVDKGNVSDENVTIDVEGEDGAGEERVQRQDDVKSKSRSLKKSLNSLNLDLVKKEPDTRTKSNWSKTVLDSAETKSEIEKPKQSDDKTKSDSGKTTSDSGDKVKPHDTGTKSDTPRTKADGAGVKLENVLPDVKHEKEGVRHKHHPPSLPTRTSKRERRRSGQSMSSTEAYDYSQPDAPRKPADVPSCPEADGDGKEIETPRVEAESPSVASPYSSRRRERRGKFKSEKVKAEEVKRAEAKKEEAAERGEPCSEPSSADRHRRKSVLRSGEIGERSNIFESLERHCQEGSYEVAEPAKLSESPSCQWLSSDWHRKLTSLVGDVAEHAKVPESAHSHQPSEQGPSIIPVVGGAGDPSDLSKTSQSCQSSDTLQRNRHDMGEVGETSDSLESERHSRKSRHHLVEAYEPSVSRESSESCGRNRHKVGDWGDRTGKLELPQKQRRKSSLGGEESTASQHLERHQQKSGVGESTDSKRSERHRRKSSHEARLKLNKVLTAVDGSSDDDFEPSKPMAATFPLRQQHARLSKKSTIKRRTRDMDLSEETSEDEEERGEGRGSLRSRHREQSQSRNSLEKSSSRTRTGGLRSELSKLLKPSDLIVEDDLIKRVENSFLRRYRNSRRRTPANGAVDNKQRKIDAFFLKNSNKRPGAGVLGDKVRPAEKSPSKNRVLNEITPEKSGNFQNHLFGAHCTPRGSLSGYKIPKKNSQASTAEPPSSPLQSAPSSGALFGMGTEFRSFRSEATAAGSPRLRRRGDGAADERTPRKCVITSGGGGSDLETASVLSTEQCEASQFSMENCHGYRSQSPSSEASTAHARHSDSRESTPRRFTRSQLAEDMVENSPSPHGVGSSSGGKMKLREGLLKASQFSC